MGCARGDRFDPLAVSPHHYHQIALSGTNSTARTARSECSAQPNRDAIPRVSCVAQGRDGVLAHAISASLNNGDQTMRIEIAGHDRGQGVIACFYKSLTQQR
jgi:hypothetical protein